MKKLSRKLGMLVLGAMIGGTALLATPDEAAAQNPWWFYIDGGYSIITGNDSDFWSGGFQTDIAFGQVFADRFAVGLFGGVGFHSAKSEFPLLPNLTVWKYGIWGGVNALEATNPWKVWFGAGPGLGTISAGGSSTTDFMLQGNLAVSRQVSQQVALGVNGTFYIIFTSGDSWTAIPLTAFVSITP